MITAKAFAGKKYAVLGLARSGAATVRSLVASGAQVMAWDDNEALAGPLLRQVKEDAIKAKRRSAESSQSSLSLKNWMLAKDLTGFDAVVVSPGVPLNRHPVKEKAERYGLPIIGDIELFARARPELPPHKVVGITGTNGKSTTTALVHHILKTAGVPTTMGGNIGLPILAQDPLTPNDKGVGVYVLELSSYQIDLTRSLDCDVAVLLNITPDHLDRYESFDAYRDSKLRLFHMQSREHDGIIVDPAFQDVMLDWTEGPSSWSIQQAPPDWSKRQARWPSLQGPHNGQNVAAATAVCREIGVNLEIVLNALETYPGLPHRMERVRDKDGVLFVNDSKATNPTAAAPALAAFERIRWICGGQAKTDNLDECAPHFGHVRSAYTIGEAAELFERLLSPHIPVKNCGKLDVAVRQAAADSEPGDTVLLSPACASFDQFRDFEDRGDQFKALVGAL